MNSPSVAVVLACLALAACSRAESRDASRPVDNVIGIVQCDDYLARVRAAAQALAQQRYILEEDVKNVIQAALARYDAFAAAPAAAGR